MITDCFVNKIFIEPYHEGCDELCILAGYASSNMASLMMTDIDKESLHHINVHLVIGMTTFSGMTLVNHEGFKVIHDKPFRSVIDSFTCGYISDGKPAHENLYIWLKDDVPVKSFMGSAPLIQSAFLGNRSELMAECDAETAYIIYREAESRSMYCNHAEIEDNVIITPENYLSENTDQPSIIEGLGVEKVTLSLLTSRGDVGHGSGINWGQREGRNPNEAYIPAPAPVIGSKFFPTDRHFTAITDDRHILILRTEQAGDKAITTPASNAQLGEYLRNRLSLPNGAFITKDKLIEYGRTDIDFCKIDDEHYYMDFSV